MVHHPEDSAFAERMQISMQLERSLTNLTPICACTERTRLTTAALHQQPLTHFLHRLQQQLPGLLPRTLRQMHVQPALATSCHSPLLKPCGQARSPGQVLLLLLLLIAGAEGQQRHTSAATAAIAAPTAATAAPTAAAAAASAATATGA